MDVVGRRAILSPGVLFCPLGFETRALAVSFIVNSSPGAGFRFEPSVTFEGADAALRHATDLSLRGMRLIKIRNNETGEIFDERGLRQWLSEAAGA